MYNIKFNDSYRHLFKTFFICSLQVILIIVITMNIWEEDSSLLTKGVNFELVVTRFICVFLLHIQIQSEVRQALLMFKYMLNHPEKFKNYENHNPTIISCFLIAIMQHATSILVEAINMLLILAS